ncbi:MAG: hypothetical protein HOQ03_06620 [Thermoleophilia bacterium]|nr:hypothetical protein [Thermoleophilia bacterium]
MPTPRPTPMFAFARFVLVLDLIAVVGAGIQLYLLSERTDELFAWTIKAPVTAAFLGAGYWSSIPIVLIALRAREWREARTLVVMGLAITGFTTLATFLHLDLFHFGSGPFTAQASAWTWLIVYIAIPPMLLAAFAIGERRGGRHEYEVTAPLRPWVRWGLLAFALPLSVLGLGLAFLPGSFSDAWPWPLTPLTAGAVAAWLLTIALGCWWSLRESDWRRVRVAFPGYLTFAALALIGAARYSEALDGGARTWSYLVALAALLLFSAVAWLQHEREPRLEPAPPTIPA